MLFRSEEAVGAWCTRNNLSRGEVLSLEQVWSLAKAWYHNRMAVGYRGRSIEQAEAVFRSVGLTGPFWSVPAAASGT